MAKYYNAMVTGTDRSMANCQNIYTQLQGYNISVIASCGNGMDGTCNKRIKYDGAGGIQDVKNAFAAVKKTLKINVQYSVNGNAKCVF